MVPPWVWVALVSGAVTTGLATLLGALARLVAGARPGWRGAAALGGLAALLVASSYTLPMLRQVERYDVELRKIREDEPRCWPPFATSRMNEACRGNEDDGRLTALHLAHEAWFAELSTGLRAWAQVGTWSLAGVAIFVGAAYLAYQVWATHHTTAVFDRLTWAWAAASVAGKQHPPRAPPPPQYLQ